MPDNESQHHPADEPPMPEAQIAPVSRAQDDDEGISPEFRRARDAAFAEIDRLRGYSIDRRRISDQVFLTIAAARRLLTELCPRERYPWLWDNLEVPVNVQEDEGTLHVQVPYVAALCLGVASSMALDWKSMTQEQEREVLRETTQRMLSAMGPGKSFRQIVESDPKLGPILDVLVKDSEQGGEKTELIQQGIDEEGLLPVSSDFGDFLVEAKPDSVGQIKAIATGVLERLERLSSAERLQVLKEMRDWQHWLPEIVRMTPEHTPALHRIYNKVRLRPNLLRRAISTIPSLKTAAIERIECGGFLHGPDDVSFKQMCEHGIAGIIDDIAYYGVIDDPKVVLQLLEEYCGFTQGKTYRTRRDLPTKSGKGWPMRWFNPRYAIAMLQNPDQVAFSVEVAVAEPDDDEVQTMRGQRRDAGIASALKYWTYTSLKQPLIFTRHYEILEIDGQSLPSAVNYVGEYFIQALGGRRVAAAEETFHVCHPDNPTDTVLVKALWHYCLAERATSLKRIEQVRSK